MKDKKLLLPGIILAVGIMVTIIVNTIICIAEEPVITEHTFPFSITYEFEGETITIEDEYICTYEGNNWS